MKILLVQHDPRNSDFPMGLGYVAGALRDAGHEVQFMDLAFERDPIRDLKHRIQRFRPDALGVTLMTSNFGAFQHMFGELDLPGTVHVVAGGVHAELEPEQVLLQSPATVVVRFEGEVIGPPLFHALEHENDLTSVPGIAYLDDQNRCVQNPPPDTFADLDAISWPAYDIMDIHRYRRWVHGHPAALMMMSRGCPFQCAFCYRGPSSGKSVRFMSVERSLAQIDHLMGTWGYRTFYFYDDIFTLKRGRTLEFCKQLIRRKIHWVCTTRVDRVDDEILHTMKRAGCVGIHFGVESGDPQVLEMMNKGISVPQIQHAFTLCHRYRIPTVAYFMLGSPWDTSNTCTVTVKLAKRIRPTVSLFFVARPYPGTLLREAYIRKGMPLPTRYEDYAHFVEDQTSVEASGAFQQLEREVRAMCASANRALMMNQLRNVADWFHLFQEYRDMYGFRRLLRDSWNRLLYYSKG